MEFILCLVRRAISLVDGFFRNPVANWCSRWRIFLVALTNSCVFFGVLWLIVSERVCACLSERASCDRLAKFIVVELFVNECASVIGALLIGWCSFIVYLVILVVNWCDSLLVLLR